MVGVNCRGRSLWPNRWAKMCSKAINKYGRLLLPLGSHVFFPIFCGGVSEGDVAEAVFCSDASNARSASSH